MAEEWTDDAKRGDFQAKAFCVAILLSAVAYCGLTDQWASFIASSFLFAIGLGATLAFGRKWLCKKSALWPYLIVAVSTAIIIADFDETTTETWQLRVGAVARDGWISHAIGRGAASHHGGVDHWITEPETRTLTMPERWTSVLNQLWFLLPVFGASCVVAAEIAVLGKPSEPVEVVARIVTPKENKHPQNNHGALSKQSYAPPGSPTCPICQGPMVVRTAKRGKHAGSRFWGCSSYFATKCKGTRQINHP